MAVTFLMLEKLKPCGIHRTAVLPGSKSQIHLFHPLKVCLHYVPFYPVCQGFLGTLSSRCILPKQLITPEYHSRLLPIVSEELSLNPFPFLSFMVHTFLYPHLRCPRKTFTYTVVTESLWTPQTGQCWACLNSHLSLEITSFASGFNILIVVDLISVQVLVMY